MIIKSYGNGNLRYSKIEGYTESFRILTKRNNSSHILQSINLTSKRRNEYNVSRHEVTQKTL